MIYLDNAATTFPKPECVYDAIDKFNRTSSVNAGRGAYKLGRDASDMIKNVRKKLINMCNARNKAFAVLAPSVTIGINQIVNGIEWKDGMNAYVSPYEHNAVLRPLTLMKKRYGINLIELPLMDDLSIDIKKTRQMFEEKRPDFVSVTAISNVTGYILPAREIFELAKPYKAFRLLDAAQAFGLMDIDFGQMGADAIAFAGHKTLYSSFGIAGFMLRYGCDLKEFIVGGNGIKSTEPEMPGYLPEKLEAGSMDTPAIAGLNAALDWIEPKTVFEKERQLMEYLIPRLEEIDDLIVYKAPGGIENQAAVISINIRDTQCGTVGVILDSSHGIAVRTGHHCAALIHKYLDNNQFKGTIRISLGAFNSREEIDTLVDVLANIDREKFRGVTPGQAIINC